MTLKHTKYLFALLLLLIMSVMSAFSQERFYRLDVGVAGGVSFYMGDANPSMPFHRSQPAYGVQLRRAVSPRYALKAHLFQGKVEGNTLDFDNRFPDNRHASFQKDIWDAGLQLEFNFLNYGLPPHLRESSRISPYIFAGIGLLSYIESGRDGTMVVNFPFGVGIKYKIFPRVNLSAAWSMHKLLTDEFDTTRSNSLLNDPYGFGKQGNWKNTDWYSFAMLSLTFDMFGEKHCR